MNYTKHDFISFCQFVSVNVWQHVLVGAPIRQPGSKRHGKTRSSNQQDGREGQGDDAEQSLQISRLSSQPDTKQKQTKGYDQNR